MRLKHINIVARDADALATFYTTVFGCSERRPPATLWGDDIDKGMGLSRARVYSVWLTFPGNDSPFLEIHQHADAFQAEEPPVDRPGYGHLAFEIPDIQATYASILRAGGRALGEVTNLGDVQRPLLAVYVRDPEGNIIELEQTPEVR